MARYVVVKSFKDLQDGQRIYRVGDEYPRKGYKPTKNVLRNYQQTKIYVVNR